MEWYYAEGDAQRGPITELEFQDLVRTGVIRADTLVWCEAMPDWRPYGQVAAQFAPAPDYAAPPPVYGDQRMGETEPLAIASLVLAALGCACGISSIAAVICGHIALSRIRQSEGRKTGQGLAIGGLVIGYIMLALNGLLVLFQILAIAASEF